MKKINLCLFVLALGTFSITGCGGDTTPQVKEQTATQAEIDAQDAEYEKEMEEAEAEADAEGG
ncbi:MAG: hypothetical protein AAFU85_02015 [Planctomycetota bacterium]